MFHLISLLLGAIAARFKSRARLEAEILILRHQLGILRRQIPKRVGQVRFLLDKRVGDAVTVAPLTGAVRSA